MLTVQEMNSQECLNKKAENRHIDMYFTQQQQNPSTDTISNDISKPQQHMVNGSKMSL
jgi:transposase